MKDKTTIDGVKDRFCSTGEEWCGRVIVFGCAIFANVVCLPKKSTTESSRDAVLEVERDRVGSQASAQSSITLDISSMQPNRSD